MDFEEAYGRYYPVIYRFLLSLSGNSALAEDLSQETFLRAINHGQDFRGDCKPETWLCAIAKNIYFDYIRKNKALVYGMDEHTAAAFTYMDLCGNTRAVIVPNDEYTFSLSQTPSGRVFATCRFKSDVPIGQINHIRESEGGREVIYLLHTASKIRQSQKAGMTVRDYGTPLNVLDGAMWCMKTTIYEGDTEYNILRERVYEVRQGTPEDYVVIWREGDKLPEASEDKLDLPDIAKQTVNITTDDILPSVSDLTDE